MPTVTATPDPATGTVRIDVTQAILRDTFTRVTANSWGTPDLGSAYVNGAGAAANYSTSGTQGVHTHTVVNVLMSNDTDLGTPDQDIRITTNMTVGTPTGAAITRRLFARMTDLSNYYQAVMSVASGTGAITLEISAVIGGAVQAALGSAAKGTHTGATNYTMRFMCCGTSLKAKLWLTSVVEPTNWDIEVSSPSITTGNRMAVASRLETGNTNAPLAINFDNALGVIGQPVRLFRVTSGVRTEVLGSPFSTEETDNWPATVYDNEAPFDVDTTYELTSFCNPSFAVATSNTFQLDSNGNGWLRDPLNPSHNVLLDFGGVIFDECIEDDRVVFSGFSRELYSNASGIFDLVNSPRPNTVSMARKDHESSFFLTSMSLPIAQDLRETFAPGTILLLFIPPVYGWAWDNGGLDYITIADIAKSRLGVDATLPVRVWEVPYRLSGPPVDTIEGQMGGNGLGVDGATWDDLAASALGVTWTNLSGSGETWLQVAQGVGY